MKKLKEGFYNEEIEIECGDGECELETVMNIINGDYDFSNENKEV